MHRRLLAILLLGLGLTAHAGAPIEARTPKRPTQTGAIPDATAPFIADGVYILVRQDTGQMFGVAASEVIPDPTKPGVVTVEEQWFSFTGTNDGKTLTFGATTVPLSNTSVAPNRMPTPLADRVTDGSAITRWTLVPNSTAVTAKEFFAGLKAGNLKGEYVQSRYSTESLPAALPAEALKGQPAAGRGWAERASFLGGSAPTAADYQYTYAEWPTTAAAGQKTVIHVAWKGDRWMNPDAPILSEAIPTGYAPASLGAWRDQVNTALGGAGVTYVRCETTRYATLPASKP